MKKIEIFLLLIISLSLLFSCVEETEIGNDIIDFSSLYNKTPTVKSHFSPDSMFIVEFGITEPAFNKEDNDELTKVLNPVIKDFKSETIYTLEQSTCADVYFAKIELTEGEAYQIDVGFPGFTESHVLATDTIPYASKIEAVEITPKAKQVDHNLLALVRLKIMPSLLQRNSNHEISVVTTITDTLDYRGFPIDSIMLRPKLSYLFSDNLLITKEDYYPSILQFDAFPPTNLFFRNKDNSESFYIDFYYEIPTSTIGNLGSGETTTRVYSHSATIFLKTVSNNYYRYSVSRFKQFYSRKGDPLYGVGEPVNVYTNIQNGTGIFASYTCDSIKYNYQSE